MNQSLRINRTTVGSWIAQKWRLLIQPNQAVTEAGNRQQAQLIAALSLVLFVLNGMGIFAVYKADNGFSVSVKMLLALAVISIIAYAISRSRAYLVSAVVITVTLSLLGMVGAIYDTHTIEIILFFVPFAFLIAMGTMPWPLIIVLTALNLLASLLLPTFIPELAMKDGWTLVGQFMTTGGLAVAVSLARNAVERSRLVEVRSSNKQLQDLNTSLEQRVSERTRDITMAAEVGRKITQVTDLSVLLSDAVNLIREGFNLYHTQIYLVEHGGHGLILKASTGAAGHEMLRRGHRLPIDMTSLNGSAALERQIVIVADTQKSPFFRPNPLLPETRSEMAIPLLSGTRIMGVLDIQSAQAGSLAEETIPAFEILAGQLTTALLNAELFAQVEQSLAEVESYNRRTARQGWDDYLDGLEHNERVAYQYNQQGFQPLAGPALTTASGAHIIEAPIVVVGEKIGNFQFVSDQPWTAAAGELVSTITYQVAQQLENLRLLTQAEQYRREAEGAVRRLVREEWDKSLQDTESGEWAFMYADGQVQVIENSDIETAGQLAYTINVQGEPVGHFGIAGLDQLSGEDAELVALIGDQLGGHLENLRLYTNARRELQERERAEQALKDSYEQIRASEELVRTIIDSTPDWIFIKDQHHRYRLANKGYADALHISSESFIGKNDLELGFPEELVLGNPEKGIRGFWSDDQNVIDRGVPQMYAHDPATVDGVLRISQTYKTPLRDTDGKIWGVLAFSRDISEREALLQNLETQQRTLQAVLDNMPAGVFMVEAPTGRPLLANKRAEELLGRGISPDAGEEQRQELFPAYIFGTDDVYPPEKMPTVVGISGQASSIDDIEIRHSDGRRVLLQVNGAPVFDTAGQTIASVTVLQDITQARQAQETIAKRAVELAMVAEVVTRISTFQNPDEMLQTVVDLTRQAFHLYHAHIYLLNDAADTLFLTRGAGEIGQKMVAEGRQIALSAEKSLVARAARIRSGVIVNNVHHDPEFLSHPLLPQTCSELAVPMIAGDRLLGVMDIQDEVINRFTPEDVNIMTTLAAQVAVSLQNARSFARAQRQAEREALINTISERIQATNSVEGALQVAVREIGRALGAQHTAIRLGVEQKKNGN